jgi:hypothetical protein
MESKERALSMAKKLRDEALEIFRPPEAGIFSSSQKVIPISLVRNTRGYIEKVANQINGCYENGWFDACAVMLRRLIETLIIESFEKHNLDHKIKNSQGDFLYLDDLIDCALNEASWNLGRNSKRALPKLKKIGDLSAHSRRYNAHLKDIEKLIVDIRVVVQELIYLSGLK